MRRLLVLVLGVLASWLGTALPAVGAPDLQTHPELVHAYAYEADGATAPYDTAIERGLPTGAYTARAARHAVGRWSCGAPACPPGSTSPSTYGYDHPGKVAEAACDAGMIRGPVEGTHGDSVAVDRGCVAANGADNVVNGTRLGQQLARESADSVFTSSGRLSSGAIADSRQIIPGSRLGNKDLIQRLTSDGSDIADWGKYTTRTHQSPSGDFQVHFYMNRGTGAIDYG